MGETMKAELRGQRVFVTLKERKYNRGMNGYKTSIIEEFTGTFVSVGCNSYENELGIGTDSTAIIIDDHGVLRNIELDTLTDVVFKEFIK